MPPSGVNCDVVVYVWSQWILMLIKVYVALNGSGVHNRQRIARNVSAFLCQPQKENLTGVVGLFRIKICISPARDRYN